MREKFPGLKISRSSVFKIQKKILRYSYKRVCQYTPKFLGNKNLKRIAFIKSKDDYLKFFFIYFLIEYFEILKDKDSMLFVIDEVGFGTKSKPLRRYAYSKIGEPAVYKTSKFLRYNLTCTTTISKFGVEFI